LFFNQLFPFNLHIKPFLSKIHALQTFLMRQNLTALKHKGENLLMKKFSVIDLFAGAGGLSLGFEQTNKYDIKVAFVMQMLDLRKTR
jgi:16S rRNA G966 N2-methylase RsmD